jgi:hypothetical protein
VAGGLTGADDGGALAVGDGDADGLAVAVGLAVALDADGPAVALIEEEGLAVVVGAAELLEGAGAGGPKQPESANTAQSPRTLDARRLGLLMVPPWVRAH